MSTPASLYDKAVREGRLHADPSQSRIIDSLNDLFLQLTQKPQKASLLQRLTGVTKTAPQGLYIYGGVGRGKSMLMDMFYEALPEHTALRVHFHDFMVMAHDEMNAARLANADQPAMVAAKTLAQGPKILCFDEMEVRDIADAMIVKRLFDGLFAQGVTVIATSNRHPDALYQNGLHRDRFLPFIASLKERCDIIEIEDGQDWRQRLLGTMPRWYHPADAASLAEMEQLFGKLASADDKPVSVTIKVAGRDICFDRVLGNIAFTNFDSLCATPLAARDYVAIADRLTGLFITDIPHLDNDAQNEARRFMWLIDALYDRGRFIVASAESPMNALYSGRQWAFEFDRTLSRLAEMTRITDS